MTKLIKQLSEPRLLLVIALGFSILATLLFLLPASGVPEIPTPGIDKLAHVGIFFIGSSLWLWFTKVANSSIITKILWVCVVIFGYGIIIETLQELFFETRTADLWDILANTVGIMFGWIFIEKSRMKNILKK